MPVNNLIKHNWDLTPLFSDDNDPAILVERSLIEKFISKFVDKWQLRSDYLSDANVLKEALDDFEDLQRQSGIDGKQGSYFYLRHALDQNNPEIKKGLNQTVNFSHQMQNKIHFFLLNLAKISEPNQKAFLMDKNLKEYKHFLEKIFIAAKYNLSEPEEKICNLKVNTSHTNWVNLTSSLLAKEQREVINEAGHTEMAVITQIEPYLKSNNETIRSKAGHAVDDITAKLSDVAEAEINSILENKKIEDDLRHRPRPDLRRHISDDINSEIVDRLIKAVSGSNNISHRYYKLLSKLLKKPHLGYHERNVTVGNISKKYSFNEAIQIVSEVLANLDPEFNSVFKKYILAGQVDVYPKQNKRSGAFCHWGDLMTAPTYILLNYNGSISDITTIAHEFGHAVNSELMRQKQNALNFGVPTSVTEVASTFMEDFVFENLKKNLDDQNRLYLQLQKLNNDISSIFRQIALYRFEQDLHKTFRENNFISKAQIGQLFKKHMSSYLGDFVDMYSGSENWWVQWPHIRYFFYTYSYAFGQLISKSLQSSLKSDPSYIFKIKELLSTGMSVSPKDIFQNLGIDISDPKFWYQGLDEINKLLDDTQELADKLDKIK